MNELKPMEAQLKQSLRTIEEHLVNALHEHMRMIQSLKKIHHPMIEDLLGDIEKENPYLLDIDTYEEDWPANYRRLIRIEHASCEMISVCNEDNLGKQINYILETARLWKGRVEDNFGDTNE